MDLEFHLVVEHLVVRIVLSQTDRINAYVFWVDDMRQWLQHGLQAILDYRMTFSL